MPRPSVGVFLHPDDPSPGSEARSASRRRRRACRYPPSGLGGVSKSSSRANRSALYSRPAAHFLKRAVDAVKATSLRQQGPRPTARGRPIGPVAHLHIPSPSRRRRRPRRRRRLSTRRLSASSPLVRAVLGLPRRYVAFPLPMVQGACCCVATSPGAHASRASATAALNVLSGSWLVL